MIHSVVSLPADGMTFRTVSFQGSQLTAGDRRRLAERHQIQASLLNPHLAAMFEQTLAQVEQRKAQGIKPERVWFVDRTEKGTPFVGDAFGFTH